jgi:alpha-ketoglutarate-dependent taurine dioxygenase
MARRADERATGEHVTATFGVEISELHGRAFMDVAAADTCLAALHAHAIVIYRDACVSDPELVAFSRMLGEVVVAPYGGQQAHPEVSAISLDPAADTLAAFRRGTFFWHLDGATDDVPQKATLLSAHEVADEGGDTEFANTYTAYAALPEEEKLAIADVKVVHSFAASQSLVYPDPTPKQRAAWDQVPTREHPLVWTRPDGRKSLLVGSTTAQVVGKPPAEGRALLDRLLEWCTQPSFVLRHRWRRGDLVVWDNTGLLHRALPYEQKSRRLLHRTTLAGELTTTQTVEQP